MKTNRVKLTKNFIDKLPLSIEKSQRYFDTDTPYLIIEVGKRSKTFKLYKKIKGKVKTITLGTFPEYSVTEMRRKAASVFVALNEGKNPNFKGHSLKSYSQSFYEYTHSRYKKGDVSESWLNSCLRHLNLKQSIYPALPDIAIEQFTQGKAYKYLNEVETKHSPTVRDSMLKVLSAMFTKAFNEEVISVNPFQSIKIIANTPRERVLSVDEVNALIESAKHEDLIYLHVLTSLILTGQRKNNVLSMRWEDINLNTKTWIIPASLSKNKKRVELSLSEQMIKLLNLRKELTKNQGEYVFPSNKKPTTHISEKTSKGSWWYRIRARAGLHFPHDKEKNVQVHDLRRTYATLQLRSGTDITVVSKNLGHSNIGVTSSVYAHTNMEQMKQSNQSYADLIFGNSNTSTIDIDKMTQEEKDHLLRELINRASP
ncbi:tyrosine-type recombinase/integrase [Pseudoalteromonas sp. KAN5]|uniref:tyrosine-type recombinase/integrase n=1 Tax=Pseudoalteromonas sp. KAN5 TaxID=2916633 RepID=UPI001FCB6220|nr:tyrosine-type recombinase/integrase [Pseudoalteromonas sp. KAN5]